jgi:hypothetical protein
MTPQHEISMEQIRADVGTVREEMLLRLGAQQNVINYTFVVLGAISGILGINKENLNADGTLFLLLAIPVLCAFLQSVYLKHQLYIEIISQYITLEIYKKPLVTRV